MPLSHMRYARRAHYMRLQQYLVDLPRTEEAPERAPRVCPGPLAARRGRVPRLRQSGVVGWLRLKILVNSWNPEDVCSVCFEKSGLMEKGVGSCSHNLHPACRYKWGNVQEMELKTQCPLCRELDRNE
ncbi:hypothetical protein BC938DRAFT_477726 [Jimgerdemannia flammicorona]|uniref:RING-type domain-containing protein n=1 Tax=Jimgerdemannia flammicorona TaxID=994334 RepID=A0A433QNX5_9FUNG|nr:hypothetical protein BC938DRAFT_477726 [Jimgerdemannia flammicorona]